MEDEVLASAGVDSFEEIFKLIFAKLYDELICANDPTAYLQFRNNGNTDYELKEKIQGLFDDAKKKWEGIFTDESKILLSPSHLAVCVASLQDIKLFNNNLDVVDDAFEYLMSKAQKGEKGQYFTPRYVIDMCVKMMNPTTKDKIIDTACGSSGFTVHSIFKVWKDIRREKGLPEGDGFTAAERIPEETNFVRDNVFAIDFDEKTVRVARTLNLIAGDGQTNVLHLNTLDYSRWGETTKQEDWIDTYNEGFKKLKKLQPAGVKDYSQFQFDLVMANPPFAGDIKENTIISHYELGKNSAGKWQNKVGRDVLFIERNLNFLKPGGRMAIVLPQGRFNNSSDKYIREFIAERCRILAVVGLHGNVFKPHTGTKTSVLFVQKWDDELCPKKEDYPIFFATMQKQSKDNSGDKIYVKDPVTGENVLDHHGHLIVDHVSYVPPTTVKNGKTLSLANVEWQVTGTALVGESLVPAQYQAVATYSASGSYQAATGYVTTAEYRGTVTAEGVGSITYTVVYTGSEIVPVKTHIWDNGSLSAPLLIIAAVLLCAGIAAVLILLRRRKNVYVYVPDSKPREYRLIAKFRVEPDSEVPAIDAGSLTLNPGDTVAVEVKKSLARHLAGREFTVSFPQSDHTYTIQASKHNDWHEFTVPAKEEQEAPV